MRVLVLLALCLASCQVATSLTVSPGYQVTTYVSGLPGTYGLSFCPNGDLYYFNGADGCLYRYPPHPVGTSSAVANNDPAFKLPVCHGAFTLATPTDANVGLTCTTQGRIYLTTGWELSAVDGSVVRRAWTTTYNHGIAADPASGRVYLASAFSFDALYVNNPDVVNTMQTPSVFATLPSVLDGLQVGPDGKLFAAGLGTQSLYVVFPNGTLAASQHNNFGHAPDGISVCGLQGIPNFVISTTGAGRTVDYWDLSNLASQQVIVSGVGDDEIAAGDLLAGYTDWSTVSPDGCVYFTAAGVGILRLSLDDGRCPCFSVQVLPCGAAADVVGTHCTTVTTASDSNAVAISFSDASTHCAFENHAARD